MLRSRVLRRARNRRACGGESRPAWDTWRGRVLRKIAANLCRNRWWAAEWSERSAGAVQSGPRAQGASILVSMVIRLRSRNCDKGWKATRREHRCHGAVTGRFRRELGPVPEGRTRRLPQGTPESLPNQPCQSRLSPVHIPHGKLAEQEGVRDRRRGWNDVLSGVGVLLERWESPDIAISKVHRDFAEHLAAAIGSAKHESSWLEIYGIRAGLCLNGARSNIKVDSDRT